MSAALKAKVAHLEQRVAFLEGVNSAIREENATLKGSGDPGLLAHYNEAVRKVTRLEVRVSELMDANHLLQTECRVLREIARPDREVRVMIPKTHWRRLAQLCHPDRHNNSVASTEAMKWLMEVRA